MLLWLDTEEIAYQIKGTKFDIKKLKGRYQTSEEQTFIERLLDIKVGEYQKIEMLDDHANHKLKLNICNDILRASHPKQLLCYPNYNFVKAFTDKVRKKEPENKLISVKWEQDKYCSLVKLDGNKKTSCGWKDLEWTEKNPQLYEMMGTIDSDKMWFYPFKRPTNNLLVFNINLKSDEFDNNIQKVPTINPLFEFLETRETYTLGIYKILKSGVIRPICIYCLRCVDCTTKIETYLHNWLENLDIEKIYSWNYPDWNRYIPQISKEIKGNDYRGLDEYLNAIDFIKDVLTIGEKVDSPPLPYRYVKGASAREKNVRLWLKRFKKIHYRNLSHDKK